MKQFKLTFLVVALMMILSNVGWGQISEGFETGLPTAYTSTTTYTLTSGTWSGQANGIIRGTAGLHSGSYSCQIRSQTGAQITTPTLSGGVGTVSFYVSASTAAGAYQVNLSTDNGATWSPATGSPYTIGTVVTLKTIIVNNPNVNKIQIYRTAVTIYIDDFSCTAYSSIKPEPTNHATSFATGTITGNSIQLNWTDATGTTLPDGYLIKGSNVGYSSITDPIDGTAESNSALVQNVTQGTQTYSFSGLSSTTTYYFKIYSYTNSSTDINYKTNGTVPQISGLTGAATTSSTDYFRSKAIGDWNATSTWESSSDNVNWINSSLTPDNNANTITILNGHTVTITGNLTVDQVVVNSGGVVVNSAGLLTINNGTGNDFTVENGGIYKVTNTNIYASAISFSASSAMLVKTGGTISVEAVTSNNNGYSTSSNIVWEDASIFNWNTTSTIGASGVTFFPNNISTFPILKIQQTPTFSIGGGSQTTFNCILELNDTISFQGAGTKTFKKGIIGNGTINQSSAGQIIFASSDGIGSNVTLNVGSSGVLVLSPNILNVSGILDCGTNLISGTGAFTLNSGGTLKTAHTSGLNGSITVSDTKTFDAGANYEFNGSGGQVTGALMPATVNNLTINNSAGVTLSNGITLNGVLSLANGDLSIGANTLTLNGTTTSTTGTITGGSTSNLTIGGTGSLGTLNFTGGSEILNNLTINRTSPGSIAFGSNLNVQGTLDLSSGNINMGANTLTLGTSTSSLGTLTPATPTSASYIIGNFERWLPTTASGDVYFPVGSSGQDRLAIINYSASSGGTLKVSGYETDPGTVNTDTSITESGGYIIDRFSKEAWWKITSTIPDGTYDISFLADAINGVSAINFDRLRILKRVNNSSSWALVGDHSPATGSSIHPLVKRIGLTGFSEFGIGGYSVDGNVLNDAPLPVTLASLNSTIINRNIKLNWTTASETNNSGFNVERMNVADNNWSKITFVSGHGTVNTPTNYSFEDRNLQTGKYKYRLKQIDVNGNFEYFNLNGEVEIGVPKTFNLSQNYPNPFNPVTKINFDVPTDGKVTMLVYDITGREIARLLNSEYKKAGYYSTDFNAGMLSSGVYFYSLSADNFRMTKKMVVLK